MGKDGVKQFLAVTGKNFILQTRSRKSFLGLGGWGALLIQVPGRSFGGLGRCHRVPA